MKGVAIIAGAGLTLAGCAFPNLSYGPAGNDDAAGVDDADSADASRAVPVESGAAADAPLEVTTNGDSSPTGGEAGEAGDDCDKDGDGFFDVHCALGTDCCDTDPKAHPAQYGYFATRDGCGSFDYDCSGAEEPEYGSLLYCVGKPTVGCIALCPSSQCTCSGTVCGYGFTGPDPGCGDAGPWGTCSPGASCTATTTMPELTQQCR